MNKGKKVKGKKKVKGILTMKVQTVQMAPETLKPPDVFAFDQALLISVLRYQKLKQSANCNWYHK